LTGVPAIASETRGVVVGRPLVFDWRSETENRPPSATFLGSG
jgi:hypothetical protein